MRTIAITLSLFAILSTLAPIISAFAGDETVGTLPIRRPAPTIVVDPIMGDH